MVKKQENITLNMDLGKMKGSGKNSKKTTDSDKTVFIPQFGDYTLKLPPFFAVPNKNGSWRLANPLTEMRNLANRQNELSINIKRANVTEPELENEIPEVTPALGSFSAKDQAKLKAYFEAVKQGKEDEYLFKNKPRGYPAVLYKNAKKAGLKETKEKVYTKNVVKKQPKIPKVKKGETPPVAEKVAEAVPVSPQNKRAEEIIKKLDEYEKTLNSQSTVYKDLVKIQNEMKDMVGEMKQDKTLTSLVKGRFNEVKELFNVMNIKFKNEKEQKKEKENTEAMGEEDKAGQKLREAEEEAKLQAEAKAFAARARAKMKAKTTGGRLPINLNPLDIIPQGLKAVKDKVVDIAQKVVKGRDGYSPSVTAIIEKFADQEVKSIELHRRVLPTVYTGLLNVLTLGEFNKRIKDQPKDKLFHISMWIKLANGKTVLVEKNEVINMKVNPKKEKEEEVQPAGAVPAGLKFGEMLDKTQKEMGGKYFTYSARDNNCGNYIEAVLKANGMNTKETNDFIGQDAKAILKGYPRIAKALNAITDIAGRANVVMEGGGASASVMPPEDQEAYNRLSKKHKKFYNDTTNPEIRSHWLKITNNDRRRLLKYIRTNMPEDLNKVYDNMTDSEEEGKEMNGDGLMGRGFHVATMSNRFHRIPQSESQIKSYFQGSGMKGSGPVFSNLMSADILEEEDRRDTIRQMARDRQLLRDQIDAEMSGRPNYPVAPVKLIDPIGVINTPTFYQQANQFIPYQQPAIAKKIPTATARKLLPQPLRVQVIPPAVTSGTGMKKPKFAKGSQEAKDYMKMLRDKRGKK